MASLAALHGKYIRQASDSDLALDEIKSAERMGVLASESVNETGRASVTVKTVWFRDGSELEVAVSTSKRNGAVRSIVAKVSKRADR